MGLRIAVRLVPVAGATWAASLAAIFVPAAAPVLSLTLWAIALVALALTAKARRNIGRRARRGGAIVVFAIALAAVAASHVSFAQPARDAVADLSLSGGRAITVDATVTGKVERRADGALAFDAIATMIRSGGTAKPVRAEIVVRVDPSAVASRQRLDVGAEIEARGTAAPARPGERAVVVLWAGRGVDVTTPARGVLAGAAALRQGLVSAVQGLPGDGAGLVPGLAVGDTSAVSAQLDAAMKESSLSHLTAVSGANCAIVVGLAYMAAAQAGAARGVRVLVGVAALTGFGLLVTPEPSVVRAGAMAAVAMLGVLLGRPGVGMAILSLAVSILLIADPWLAGSLGFALSSVATASLLLFARPLAAGLGRVLPKAVALAVSVPLAAQLACGPLLVLITPQIPVYGVIANLLAGPAAPMATVVGLAACLAAPVPWLQDGLAAVAWLPASWIAATAHMMVEVPGDVVPWLEGWPGAASLAVLGLAIGVLIVSSRSTRRRTRTARVLAGTLVAVVAGLVAGGGALATVAGRFTVPVAWSVIACDVGQGDAVLLRSHDAIALVDTGPSPDALARCLDRVGIQRIDLLVLTHFDLDHVGGVDAVRGRVGTVLHGPADADATRVLRRLGDGGARLLPAHEGLAGQLGAARWGVLWPPPRSLAFPSGNDASIVLDIRGGGIPAMLMLGDLSASPQRALSASGSLRAPYAVVKVAHHGSADQEAGLYAEAAAALALVTVGADNDYGHPRDELLALLKAGDARIARTDLDGLVAIWETDGGVAVWRERGGQVGGAG